MPLARAVSVIDFPQSAAVVGMLPLYVAVPPGASVVVDNELDTSFVWPPTASKTWMPVNVTLPALETMPLKVIGWPACEGGVQPLVTVNAGEVITVQVAPAVPWTLLPVHASAPVAVTVSVNGPQPLDG